MQMLFRYIFTAIKARRRPRIKILDEAKIELRVRPSDCDSYLHINNGRYLTIMDIGRIDYVTRCGLTRKLRERQWKPVAAGATIRFRRELRMFARYSLTTRCIGWSGTWIFFEQQFHRANGDLAAKAFAKITVLDGEGQRVSAEQVVTELGVNETSPPLPTDLTTWLSTEYG